MLFCFAIPLVDNIFLFSCSENWATQIIDEFASIFFFVAIFRLNTLKLHKKRFEQNVLKKKCNHRTKAFSNCIFGVTFSSHLNFEITLNCLYKKWGRHCRHSIRFAADLSALCECYSVIFVASRCMCETRTYERARCD